jgi:hypothetical protein
MTPGSLQQKRPRLDQRNVSLFNYRPQRARPVYMALISVKRSAAVFAVCLAAGTLLAQAPSETNDFRTLLARATRAELPALAARLVQQARSKDRISTATNVVREAVRMNPVATVAIVGAVVQAEPDAAGVIAEAAASQEVSLAPDIARVAAAVASPNAGEVVVRVGRVTPEDLRDIAVAASSLAPMANREILRAVGTVRPELGPYIEIEISRCGRKVPPVSRCLDRAEAALALVRPPFGPVSSKPGNERPSGGMPSRPIGPKPSRGEGHPPGGRNYARP